MAEPSALQSEALVATSAVAQLASDAAVMRIGRVTRYNSAAITIEISGSDTLIDAAYLFGQYGPVLGDIVIVLKSGATWVVLGTLSGPAADNAILNDSFEDGATGSAPPNWSWYHDPASTMTINTPTAEDTVGSQILDGTKHLRMSVTVAAAGVGLVSSTDYMYSSPFPVQPGELWSASAYALGSYTVPDGAYLKASIGFAWFATPTDTYPSTVAADSTLVDSHLVYSLPWTHLSTPGATGGVIVPAGAVYGRVLLKTFMMLDRDENVTGNLLAIKWDRVIARRVA